CVVFRAFGLCRKNRARLHVAAVQLNRAGAALARIAPDMGAGEAQMLAQKVNQQGARLDRRFMLYTIYGDAYGNSRVFGFSSHVCRSSIGNFFNPSRSRTSS